MANDTPNTAYNPFAVPGANPYLPQQLQKPETASAPPAAPAVEAPDLTWDAVKSRSNYDALAPAKQLEVRQGYIDKVIPYLASQHGEDAAAWQAEFQTQVPEPDQSGDFMRGLKRTLPELKQLSGASIGFIGDATGIDAVRDWGYGVYKEGEERNAALSRPTDSFTQAWNQFKQGDVGAMADFLQNAAGYTTGQALEAMATMAAGALVGTSGGPVGTVAGAAGGLVTKGSVKKLILEGAEKVVKEQLEKGVEKSAAERAGKEYIAKQMQRAGGAAVAGAAFNVNMELGSIYGEGRSAAEEEGRTLTQGDLGRMALAAGGAAAVETAADFLNVGALAGASQRTARKAGSEVADEGLRDAIKGYAKRAAVEVPSGMAREGLTEATQTQIERWGMGKPVYSPEGITEIIDSAAVGAVGGGLFGGAAAVPKPKPKDSASAELADALADPSEEARAIAPPTTSAQPSAAPIDAAPEPPATVDVSTGEYVPPTQDELVKAIHEVLNTWPSEGKRPNVRQVRSALEEQFGAVNTRDFHQARQEVNDQRNRGITEWTASAPEAADAAIAAAQQREEQVVAPEPAAAPAPDSPAVVNSTDEPAKMEAAEATQGINAHRVLSDEEKRALSEWAPANMHPSKELNAGHTHQAAQVFGKPEYFDHPEVSDILARALSERNNAADKAKKSSATAKRNEVDESARKLYDWLLERPTRSSFPAQGKVWQRLANGNFSDGEKTYTAKEAAEQLTNAMDVVDADFTEVPASAGLLAAPSENAQPGAARDSDRARVMAGFKGLLSKPAQQFGGALLTSEGITPAKTKPAMSKQIDELLTARPDLLEKAAGAFGVRLGNEANTAEDIEAPVPAKKSVVVNEDGTSKTVYHGTPSNGNESLSPPIFFSEDKDSADWFRQDDQSGETIEAHLDIRAPLDATTRAGMFDLIQFARNAGVAVESDITRDGNESWDFNAPEIAKHSPYDGTNALDLVYIPEVREALKAAGYDGVTSDDTLENTQHRVWVAFDSAQVQIVGRIAPETPEHDVTDDQLGVAAHAFADSKTNVKWPGRANVAAELTKQFPSVSEDRINDVVAKVHKQRKDDIKSWPSNAPAENQASNQSVDASKLVEPVADSPRKENSKPAPAPKQEPAPEPQQFANNKVFTADMAAAARARLKSKFGQLNSGFDPTVAADAMVLAGAYIEEGARKFSDYAARMVEDFGDVVKPYLLSAYESVRNFQGFDSRGMDEYADAAAAFNELLSPKDLESEAIGNATPAPKRRAKVKEVSGDKTLRADWGVDYIDGFTVMPGVAPIKSDFGVKNGVKAEFLKDARAYLKAVAEALEGKDFTATTSTNKGKAKANPTVSVNEGGVAGSGEVSLHMVAPDGTGIYVQVGGTSLRGAIPTNDAGVSIMYRTTEGTSHKSGVNNWARLDLSAADFAETLAHHVERNPWKAGDNKGATPVFKVIVNVIGADGLTEAERAAQKTPELESSDIQPTAIQDAVESEPKTPALPGTVQNAAPAGGTIKPQDNRGDEELADGNRGRTEVDGPRSLDRASTQGRSVNEGSGDVRDASDQRSDRSSSADQSTVAARDAGRRGTRKNPTRVHSPATGAVTAPDDLLATVGELNIEAPPTIPSADFSITADVELGSGGEVRKFNDNIAAIQVLRALAAENRRATPDEQITLARYVGWGGLPQAFRHPTTGAIRDGWKARVEQLEGLLSSKELSAARRSTQDAHYTAQGVVKAMWEGLKRMGVRGGNMLEPSSGTGNFIGLQPDDMKGASNFVAIEYDNITAQIAAALYPNQTVLHSGAHTVPLPQGAFDVAIGNPPFGEQSLHFQYVPEARGESIHNQFFIASMKALKPNGIMAMVVSRYLMDAKNTSARKTLAGMGELLGAIRLPQTAFQENARTEVVTDIIFMRRYSEAEAVAAKNGIAIANGLKVERDAPITPAPDWISTSSVPDPLGGDAIEVNSYFAENPRNILGTLDRSGTMRFNNDVTVHLADGQDLQSLLDAAIARLPQNVINQSESVTARSAESFERMSEGLRLAISGAEEGRVQVDTSGNLIQTIGREDGTGGYQLTTRTLTVDSPWSPQLEMDEQGRWFRTILKLDASGRPVKRMENGKATRFNDYTRETFTSDADVPKTLRLGETRFERIKEMVRLRDLLVDQLTFEAEDRPAADLDANRAKLRGAYEEFVKAHGFVNDPKNASMVGEMPDGALILALESYKRAITAAQAKRMGEKARAASASPAPILSQRVVPKYEPATKADNAEDAMVITLAERGRLDMERVSQLLGKTEEETGELLFNREKPLAYLNPETGAWEPAELYLTGNVRRKLSAAQAAGLTRHVEALEKVQPEPLQADQVTARIGASWIPTDVYARFLEHLTDGKGAVTFAKLTNTYGVQLSEAGAKSEMWHSMDENGHLSVSVDALYSDMLNSRATRVTWKDREGRTHVDEAATKLAGLKRKEIAAEFEDWIFRDVDRRQGLVELFNDLFNVRVRRTYDGSHLTLPGKVPDSIIRMRRHQNNAIWRGVVERFLLLDHAVGAGKTFTAIARAMERRRMGLSRKPMIAVPNHMVEQFAADTYKLYPGARVLAAGKKDFERSARRRLFANIATGDWDIVIVPHSSFGFIGLSPDTEARYLEMDVQDAQAALEESEKADTELGFSRKSASTKSVEKRIEKLTERLRKLRSGAVKDRLVTFEQMGVDDLTIDEAHEFKNLFYNTSMNDVRGLGNAAGSGKALDLYNKVRSLRESPTGTVTFLTGTPISNSAVEMYTLMRYLAPEALEEGGIDTTDAWINMFAGATTKWEPTEAGGLKEVNRVGRHWGNMRSLMELYYSFTDTVSNSDIEANFLADYGTRFPIPEVSEGGRVAVVSEPTPEQAEILEEVLEGFRGLKGISDPKARNATRLRLMDRARKVALDARAAGGRASEPGSGKIGAVVEKVLSDYKKWGADKGTQLIFLDRSVPSSKGDNSILKTYDALLAKRAEAIQKGDESAITRAIDALEAYDENEMSELRAAANGGWNAYEEIKKQLVANGIPASEIRFIQEANSDEQKQAIFDAVKGGEVRVLIGSTPRMGAGTNVQDRLVALHHVDVTWKPSDIEQREGRIIRQGNKLLEKYGFDDFKVGIYAYATTRTIDSKMWDLNATKLRMINGLRKYDGALEMEFDDSESVSMEELSALASGDPLLMERVQLNADVESLELAARSHRRKVMSAEDSIVTSERKVKNLPAAVTKLKARLGEVKKEFARVSKAAEERSVTIDGTTYTDFIEAQRAASAAVERQKGGNARAPFSLSIDGTQHTSLSTIDGAIIQALGDPQPFEFVGNDGTAYSSRRLGAAAIAEAANETKGEIDGKKIGTMLGLDVLLFATPVTREVKGADVTNWEIELAFSDGEGGTFGGRTGNSELRQVPVATVRTAMEKLFDEIKPGNIEAQIDRHEKAIRDATDNLPRLREIAGTQFNKTAELEEKRQRLREITAALSETKNAALVEDPANPPDANADTRFNLRSDTLGYSGIPQGLQAYEDNHSNNLERRLAGFSRGGGESPRFRTVDPRALPDALSRALRALQRFSGSRIVIARNLNADKSGLTFNGVTFREGVLYVDESATSPATTVASHEFVHQLRKDRPDLYKVLEDEVRRQGKIGDYADVMRRRGETRGTHVIVEELTADAVGDALTDRVFLTSMKQRNPSKFKELADAFIAFLDTMLGRIRDLGSNKYLTDVATFRALLADVMDEFEPGTATAANPSPMFSAKPDRDWNAEIPVVGIAGGLFGDTVGDTSEARKKAAAYLRRLRDTGRKMKNADTGWEVGLSGASIRELIQFRPDKLNLIGALPRITKVAVLASSERNMHSSPSDSVIAFHTLYAPVNLNGVSGIARLVLREDVNGNYAYDLQHSEILNDEGTAIAVPSAGIPHIGGGALRKMTVRQLRDTVNRIDRDGWAWFSRKTDDPTNTAAFKRWFGDSKVVDAEGKPLVVYHGSPNAIRKFDTTRDAGNGEVGAFFTTNREGSSGYGDVTEAYLSILSPYEVTAEQWANAKGLSPLEAREAGFDGYIVRGQDVGVSDEQSATGDTFIAFSPEQIKSATDNAGNDGDFDSENPSIMFSRRPSTASQRDEAAQRVLNDLEAVMMPNRDATSIKNRFVDWLKDVTPAKLKDATRTSWLGALTTRHLTELGADYMDGIKHYSAFLQEMGAYRNKLQTEADGLAEKARSWASKNRVDASRLFKLMHQATIDGVDPAKDYVPLRFKYAGMTLEVTPENVKTTIEQIKDQMRGRGGDSKQDMINEVKMLKSMLRAEPRRRATYPGLRAQFESLPTAAKNHYVAIRDMYAARFDETEAALIARINDSDATKSQKTKLVNMIRLQFETTRLQGVYFPLQRYGRYFVAAEREGVSTYVMFEREAEMERAVKSLKVKGFTIKAQGLKAEVKAQDAPSGTFVADVITKLREAHISDRVQDEIYQVYLETLPELSMRKHQIHRKSVPGFDPDALRAFAHNMNHGSHQLARLRFSHHLTNTIDMLQKNQDMERRLPDADTKRILAGDAILGELNKRHQWIMNPTDSPLTNKISAFGFVYYLGLTPAAALVNLTQNAIITYPYLAARFGADKAMGALMKAGMESGKTLGRMEKHLVNADERRAHDALVAAGVLDKTQAHNLAGIAEGGLSGYNPKLSKAMEIIGWGFHKTEVINREASGMAAYRLARNAGQSHDSAVQTAIDTINETHYDYTNQNRARFMQSGFAKVVLMFKQYSLNTTWHLARMLWQATKNEDPVIRRIARRNLAGVLGMTGLFAGAMGLPITGMITVVLNAVAASFGDDDEPWDAETEFRAFLVDLLGADAADVVLNGAANAVTGADIASRTSMSDMWFRAPDKELEGKDAYYYLLEQLAGPAFGTVKNMIVAKNQFDEGHTQRAVETAMPKAVRDWIKSGRYAAEGVNSMRGDAVVPDLSVRQLGLQFIGFTPAEVSDQYTQNNAIKLYEQHVINRRSRLMDAYALATRNEDATARADVMREIAKFNQRWPKLAITGKTIARSLKSRQAYSDRAQGGVVLNKKIGNEIRNLTGYEE